MSDRDAFREAREHGLRARHETREARAVRKAVAEEIALGAEEVASGVLDPEPMFNRGFVAACKAIATIAREIGSRDPA